MDTKSGTVRNLLSIFPDRFMGLSVSGDSRWIFRREENEADSGTGAGGISALDCFPGSTFDATRSGTSFILFLFAFVRRLRMIREREAAISIGSMSHGPSMISDLERALLDAAARPELIGGAATLAGKLCPLAIPNADLDLEPRSKAIPVWRDSRWRIRWTQSKDELANVTMQ